MASQLQFEQRSDSRWFAELDDGAFYRIEMRPGSLTADYDLTLIERKADRWVKEGWSLQYGRVSTHRSLERAIERANRHHRNRVKGA